MGLIDKIGQQVLNRLSMKFDKEPILDDKSDRSLAEDVSGQTVESGRIGRINGRNRRMAAIATFETVSVSDLVTIGDGVLFTEETANRIRRAARSLGLSPLKLPEQPTRHPRLSSMRVRALTEE